MSDALEEPPEEAPEEIKQMFHFALVTGLAIGFVILWGALAVSYLFSPTTAIFLFGGISLGILGTQWRTIFLMVHIVLSSNRDPGPPY